MRHLFFSFILIISSTLYSQEISGFVVSKTTNKPLENVSVYIEQVNTGTTTNDAGAFTITSYKKLLKRYQITFSLLGYYQITTTIDNLIEHPVIKLSEKIESLDKVTIDSKVKKRKSIPFKELASLNTGVHSFDSELIDGKLYVAAGDASFIENPEKEALLYARDLAELLKELRPNYSWENYNGTLNVYDFATDSWNVLSKDLSERAYHTTNFHNNIIYVLGGKKISVGGKREYLNNTIELYNIQSDSIIVDLTNPHQAANAASFIFEDNIIIMGGSTKLKNNGKKLYTNTSHIYNITSGYWYKLPNMLKEKEANGVVIDNTIYLIGGHNNRKLSDIESYNISTGKWTPIGTLFEGMNQHAITANKDEIFIFEDEKLIVIDLKAGSVIEYAINLSLKSSNLHYYQEKLYIIGVYIESNFSKTPSKNLYSIDLNDIPKTRIKRFKYLDNALQN